MKIVLFCFILLFNKFLFSQEPRLVLPIGHTEQISCASFSNNGKFVVSCSEKGKIILWDAASGKEILAFESEMIQVHLNKKFISVSFSPDDQFVLVTTAASNDYMVLYSACSVYNLNGDLVKRIPMNSERNDDPLNFIDFTNERTVRLINPSIYNEKDSIFDVHSEIILENLHGNNGNDTLRFDWEILSVQFSEDGNFIYALGVNDLVKFDLKGSAKFSIALVNGRTSFFNPFDKSNLGALNLGNGFLKIIDLNKGKTIRTHKNVLGSLFYFEENNCYSYLTEDSTRVAIDFLTGDEIWRIKDNSVSQFFENMYLDQSGKILIGTQAYDKTVFYKIDEKVSFKSDYSSLLDCSSNLNKLLENPYFTNQLRIVSMNGFDETVEIGGHAEAQDYLIHDTENNIIASESFSGLKYWNLKDAQPLDQKKSVDYGFIKTINPEATIGLMKDSINNYSLFHASKGKINKTIPLTEFKPYIEENEIYWGENNGRISYYLNSNPVCLGKECQQLLWLLNDTVIGIVNSDTGEIIHTEQTTHPMARLVSSKSGKKAISYNALPIDDEPENIHFTLWNSATLLAEKTITVDMYLESNILAYSFSENEESLFVLYNPVNVTGLINILEIDLISGKKTVYTSTEGPIIEMGVQMVYQFGANTTKMYEQGNMLIIKSGNLSILANKETKRILATSDSDSGNLFNPKGDKHYTYHGPFLSVYDIKTGSLLYSLKSELGAFKSVVFSKQDEYLIASTNDSMVLIFDGTSGKLVRTFTSHSPFRIHEISPDLKIMSGMNAEGSFQLWDLQNGKLIWTLLKESSWEFQSSFIFDNGKKVFYLITDIEYSLPPKGFIIDIEKDSILYESEFNMVLPFQHVFSDSTQNVLINGTDLFYISDTVEVISLGREYISVEMSPDGKLIVLGQSIAYYEDQPRSIEVYDIVKRKTIFSTYGDIAKLSPDQKHLAVANEQNTLKIYDFESQTEIAAFNLNNKNCTQFDFTEYGKRLIAFCTEENWGKSSDLYCIEIGNPTPLWVINDIKGDQFTILSGSKYLILDQQYFDGNLLILDLATGEQVKKFRRHTLFADYAKNSVDHLLLYDGQNQKLNAYDLNTFSLKYSLDDDVYGNAINDLVIKSDFYIEEKNQYETVVRRGSNREIIYTRVQLAGDDWLVYDEFYRYDGSPAAREKLHFVCGMEILDLNQMKDALYVPGLAERKINNLDINYPKLSELDICSALPIIERLPDAENGAYVYQITPQRLNLNHCEIYVESKLIKTIPLSDLKKVKDAYILIIPTKEIEPHLIPGESSEIRMVAVVKKGLSELRSRGAIVHSVLKAEKEADVNLYAIMVGVNDYKADELDLQFPVKDATSLGASLEQSAKKLLGDDHVFMYHINSEVQEGTGFSTPEREGVRKAFEEIGKKAKAEDIVLVFFAGHGVMQGTADKKFTFLTAEANRENLIGISTTDLQSWLSPEGPYKMLANKTILIFDACNSGQASKELIVMSSRNDDDSKRIRQVEDLKDKSGMFILAASAPDQSAYELPQYQQGLLTYALLKTLKYNASILDENQFLNVQKWFLESEAELKRIIESLGQEQNAQPFGSSNIRIGTVDKEVQESIHLASEKPFVVCVNAEDITTEIDHLKLQEKVNDALIDLNARGVESKVSYVSQPTSNTNLIKLKYEIKGTNIICNVSLIKDEERYLQHTIQLPQKDLDLLVQKIILLAEENAK